MSRYNFHPSIDDHCSLLVLIRPCHELQSNDVSYLLQKLNELSCVAVGASGRILTLKFIRSISKDQLDWYKLQAHRRVVGLIALARLPTDESKQENEMDKINQNFNATKIEFQTYLFDSRCIVLKSRDQNHNFANEKHFFLDTDDDGITPEFESFFRDFVSSLFHVLEAKRVKALNEKLEHMPLPVAPNESEQALSDSDARNQKHTRIIGRNYKLRGDICLLSGLNQEAFYNYYHAAETLKPINDTLWRGVALEGLCAASCAMRGKLERDLRSEPRLVVKTVNANISPSTTEDSRSKTYTPLSDFDLVDKYSEVLGYYRKFKLGPVDIEAHLKFISFLLKQKKKLEVCQVLQSFLAIGLTLNAEEKIGRHQIVAGIYKQMNFFRKAAFFNRLAALCPHNNKQRAYSILDSTLLGYGLELEPCQRDTKEASYGWPALQLRILQEMRHVSCSRWTSVRLMCFLLEKYQNYMTDPECGEMVTALEDFLPEDEHCRDDEDGTEQHELFRSLPIVRNFKPRKMAHHLRAFQLLDDSLKNTGPFIFSSLTNRPTEKVPEEIVQWVCNDVAEVGMTVENPLPAEIKVNKMVLITEGSTFEAFPATLALPALSGSFPFMLLGMPTEPGSLFIKGYTIDLFGIESTVFLENPINVIVNAPMPLLELTSNLSTVNQLTHSDPEDVDYQTLFTCISLYSGHSYPAEILIENVGKLPVHWIDIKASSNETDCLIDIDADQLADQLPLVPESSIKLKIIVMPPAAWRLHGGTDRYQAAVKFQYTNDNCENITTVRNITMVTEIKIIPSLQLSQYELFEIERHPSCFCVNFMAANLTSVAMRVTAGINDTEYIKVKDGCPINDEVSIEPKSSVRMCVHFPRFNVQIDTTMKKKVDVAGKFSQAVKDAISLEWCLSESSYHGLTYWHNFSLTDELVSILKPKHLDIVLQVRNEAITEGDVLTLDKCQLAHINVQLLNVHDFDLNNLLLNVHPSQEHCSDLTSPPSKVAMSGILTKNIKKLSPGEMFEHSCGLMFLYGGTFYIDVICCVDRHPSAAHLSRARAQAMINDFPGIRRRTMSSNQMHIVEDGDWWRSIDSPPGSNNKYQLRKPIHDFWCRSFRLDVT